MNTGALPLAREVTALLEGVGIDYVIGGSVASSLVGEPRATVDLDIAVALTAERVQALLDALAGDYYFSESAMRDAVHRKGSCNVIHLDTMQKVDLFVLGDRSRGPAGYGERRGARRPAGASPRPGRVGLSGFVQGERLRTGGTGANADRNAEALRCILRCIWHPFEHRST